MTDRVCEVVVLACDSQAFSFHIAPDSFAIDGCHRQLGRRQHRKFRATDSCRDIDAANATKQHVCQITDDLASGLMPNAVVNLLEMIDAWYQ